VSSSVGEWVAIGPTRIGPAATGVLFSIAIEASAPNVLYVASPFCGVWKTEDGTASWRVVGDNLPTLAVAALATDPSTPGRVYAALAGSGVYRSNDGGGSWVAVGGPADSLPPVTDLIVDPADPSVLFLRGETSIFRSDDGGRSWQRVKTGAATALVLDSTRPAVLYAGFPAEGVLRTSDGGVSGDPGWSNLTPMLPMDGVYDVKIALTRADPRTIYARFQRHGEADVYRSTDGGASWSSPLAVAIYTALIAADDSNPQIVYLAGVDFYRSDDGGATWHAKPGAHVDHHQVAADPTDPATIYTACDGGLYRSPNRGDSWSFAADGLANVLFYDLAVSVTQPNVAIGGTQDNGTALYDGSSTVWRGILDGDGATVAIDPADGAVMYAMDQYASSIARSTDGGASFQNIADGLPAGAECFNLHFQVHPGTPTILLASCRVLWHKTDPASPWTQLFAPPGAQESVIRSAVEPRTDTYFAATDQGRLFVGQGGSGWQLVFSHPRGAPFADLVVDPDDPAVLYAAFSGTGAGRIYRLRGSAPGPGPLRAMDLSAGLPGGLAVRTLAVDAMAAFTIYAGTNRGVFRGWGERAITWSSYSTGMPAADVRALRVHPSTGAMRAATFGRGAYEVNTDFPIGSLVETVGLITFLRAHEVGSGFGRPPNFLDAEVIVLLADEPGRAFGFKLRADAEEPVRRQMLALLRAAFVVNRPVRIDYVRTGPRVGEIIRVANP